MSRPLPCPRAHLLVETGRGHAAAEGKVRCNLTDAGR